MNNNLNLNLNISLSFLLLVVVVIGVGVGITTAPINAFALDEKPLIGTLFKSPPEEEDEEGTVQWFKGKIDIFIPSDPMLLGQKQYFQVDLIHFDSGDLIHDDVKGNIEIIFPGDDVKTYDFETNNGNAYVDFSIGDDDDFVSPPGTYTIHATTDDNEYEEYWGTIRVVDHYEN